MELQARVRTASWKTLEAYGASLALLALLIDLLPIQTGSGYPTLAASFVALIREGLLPLGWTLISTNSESTETYAVASVVLAFLLSYPLAAYAGIKRVSHKTFPSRALSILIAAAIALFYAGAVFGYYFGGFYLRATAPVFTTALCCFVDAFAFYTLVMKAIMVFSLTFTSPVYVLALIRRRKEQTRDTNAS